MTTITHDLNPALDLERSRAEELAREEESPISKQQHPFKQALRDAELEEALTDEEKECIISILELPRHHFNLPEDFIEEPTDPIHAVPVAVGSAAVFNAVTSGVSMTQPAILAADIEALFEKMASSMLILSSTRETETTLFLDSPQFANSPFYGTRVTIKEFTTAPKAFNIEIATSAIALAKIEAHKSALMTAFQQGNFGFSIGRLDTGLHDPDRPLFHRKEAVSQDEEDQQQ